MKQLQKRMALMEDIHINKMDSIAGWLRSADEERQKGEEECEGLKRELTNLEDQSVQFLFYPIFFESFLISPIFKLKPPIFPIFLQVRSKIVIKLKMEL